DRGDMAGGETVERAGRGEHEEVGAEAFPVDAAQAGDAALEAPAGDVEGDVVAELPAQRSCEVLLDRQLRSRRHGLAPELPGDNLVVVAQRVGERQVELALGATPRPARIAAPGLDAVGRGLAARWRSVACDQARA